MKTTKTKITQPVVSSPVTAGAPEAGENLTRIMAHQIFEQRGRQLGRDLDDWLAAEKDLAGKQVDDIKGMKRLKNKSTIG